jgi:hypothetical protein
MKALAFIIILLIVIVLFAYVITSILIHDKEQFEQRIRDMYEAKQLENGDTNEENHTA